MMEEEYPLEGLEQPMTVEEKKARLSELQREIKTAKMGAEQEIRQILHELYPDAPKPSFEFVDYAHNLIVTNNLDIRSAVILALDYVGKDEDWYDATLYKPVKGLGYVVDKHKRKAGHVRLVQKGSLVNRDLRKSKHTAEYLGKLEKAKTTADRLDDVEERLTKAEIEIKTVNIRHSIVGWMNKVGLSELPDFDESPDLAKSFAMYLVAMSVPPQDIADYLGINVRTVYRWTKSFRKTLKIGRSK